MSGGTLEDFEAGRWDGPTNADFDWTDAQEERAAGYPGAMPSDYQDPGLTAAIQDDAAEDDGMSA